MSLLAYPLLKTATSGRESIFFWNGLFYQNDFIQSLKILISVAVLGTLWLQHSNKKITEYFVVLIGGALSAEVLISSASLFGIYVALEMLSICGYLLVSFHEKQNENQGKLFASSLNYLIFGAVCSACMLYGFSWLYGVSYSFSISEIFQKNYSGTEQTTFLIGLGFFSIGFLFKLAAVPFHFWISEVYKNASSATNFFLGTVPKIAVSGVLFFVLNNFEYQSLVLQKIIFSAVAFFGIASALIGGFLAIQQSNVKRFFAYSAVSQIGFLLILMLYSFENKELTQKSVLIFWIFYLISNLIIWKFCSYLDENNKHGFADLSALLSPLQKIIFSLSAISLAGLPPLGGFLVKLIVFFTLWKSYQNYSESFLLFAFVGISTATLIGFFYYLKITYYFFLKDNKSHTLENKFEMSILTTSLTLLLLIFNVLLVLWIIPNFSV